MTARPEPVSDERLEELAMVAEQAASGTRASGSHCKYRDLASALRELQRLRAGRVPLEPIELERDHLGDD